MFSRQGNHVERYASRFGCVEINSSLTARTGERTDRLGSKHATRLSLRGKVSQAGDPRESASPADAQIEQFARKLASADKARLSRARHRARLQLAVQLRAP